MTQQEFINRITLTFGHAPTPGQENALRIFARFLADRRPNAAMILRGSAGTGKTSLVSAMVRTLASLRQHITLLAPTGRAAKVLATASKMPAYTIHRRIYREKAYTGIDGSYNLAENRNQNMLFVVDEASMISSLPTEASSFGSGSLLDDLIKYVYNGNNCRLLLTGDSAQLPPVGEDEAPALSAGIIEAYGLVVYQCDLNDVLRQSSKSGILYNATVIRSMITHDDITGLPKIRFKPFPDVISCPGNELIERLSDSYSEVGEDNTIVVTRSNKTANIYNDGIRRAVLDREDAISGGDLLMIVKNNYSVEAPDSGDAADGTRKGKDNSFFLANGDRCTVIRAHNFTDLYGFHFADATLRFPDYNDYEIEATILLDTLTSQSPSLTHEQQEQLYNNVMDDYADIPLKGDRIKAIKKDKYFNALQVKFAYAVTCHKAQGGQWAHVYIDQGFMTDDMLTPDYIHWLYTAFTRATEKLYLINWPQTQTEDEE